MGEKSSLLKRAGARLLCILLASEVAFGSFLRVSHAEENETPGFEASSLLSGPVLPTEAIDFRERQVQARSLDLKLRGHQTGGHPLDAFSVLDNRAYPPAGDYGDLFPPPVALRHLALRVLEVTDDFYRGGLADREHLNEGVARTVTGLRYSDFAKPDAQTRYRSTVEAREGSSYAVELIDLNRRDFAGNAETVHRFALKTRPEAVAFLGHHLVFIEPELFHAERRVQYISFVDLDFFEKQIGVQELGVFRFPIHADVPVTSLRIEDGMLKIGTETLSVPMLEKFSQIFQVAWNCTAAALETGGEHLAQAFTEYFEKNLSLSAQAMESQLTRSIQFQETLRKIHTEQRQRIEAAAVAGPNAGNLRRAASAQEKLVPSQIEAFQGVFAQFEKSAEVERMMGEITEHASAERSLLTRMQLLWAWMSLPRPMAAPSIQKALAMVAAGMGSDRETERQSLLKEGARHLVSHKYARRGAVVVGAAVAALLYPEQANAVTHQTLTITSQIIEVTIGKVWSFGALGAEAISKVAYGFNPANLVNAYGGDRFEKFLIGLSTALGMLYLSVGLPHICVGISRFLKELRSTDLAQFQVEGEGKLQALKRFFIARENRDEKSFVERQTSVVRQEEERIRKQAPEFTEAQNREAQEYVAQAMLTNRGFLDFLKEKLKVGSGKDSMEMTTLFQAMRHFVFSFCRLNDSGKAYTAIWSGWFALCSFILNPTIWMTYLIYPEFFSRSLGFATPHLLSGESHRIRLPIPSDLNGGLRTRRSQMWIRMNDAWAAMKHPGKIREKIVLYLQDPGMLGDLRKWEEKILPIESQIQEIALRKSLRTVARATASPEALARIFPQGGMIADYFDPRLQNLTADSKVLFKAYFGELFEKSMQRFLFEVAERVKPGAASEEASLSELKALTLRSLEEMDLRPADAERIVESESTPELLTQVQAGLEKAMGELEYRWPVLRDRLQEWLKKGDSEFRDRVVRKADPRENGPMASLLKANALSDDPQSMARATRKLVTNTLVDSHISLFFIFVCLAGQKAPFLQPIQDEMFSETSWMYLSKYVFAYGFIYATVAGVFGGVWRKLIFDNMQKGEFGEKPVGADAELPYWKWYLKKFSESSNSLFRNHVNNLRFVLTNVKASLTVTMISHLLTMGRFDFDLYFVSYFFAFFIPISAFQLKTDQTVDLSLGWARRKTPEYLERHPSVWLHNNLEEIRLKIKTSFVLSIFWNVAGEVTGSFQHMQTALFGPRSFLRILNGGWTITERVVQGLYAVENSLPFVPGLKYVTGFCAELLTHQNVDLVQLKNLKK